MSSLIDLCLAEPSLVRLWDFTTDVEHTFAGGTHAKAVYGTEYGYPFAAARYVDLGNKWSTALNGATGISVLGVCDRNTGSIETVIHLKIDGSNHGCLFRGFSNNALEIHLRSRSTDTIQTLTAGSFTAVNGVQIGAAADFSSGNCELYKAGVSQANGTLSFGAGTYQVANPTGSDYLWARDAVELQASNGYFIALFNTRLASAKFTAFAAATRIRGSALFKSGDKLATIADTLDLPNGTYSCRVFDSAIRTSITRAVWSGTITVTGGVTSTQVRTAQPSGRLAYCVITSQGPNQSNLGAKNTVAAPLVLNHV